MNRKNPSISSNVKTGDNMVYLGDRNTRDCVSTNQTQIYSQHFIPYPDGMYTAAQM